MENHGREEPVKLAIQGTVNQIDGLMSNELVLKIGFNYFRVGEKNLKG